MLYIRFSILLIILSSGKSLLFSQDSTNAHIDSLRIVLMNMEDNDEKVAVYNELSEQYLGINYNESIKYSELALDMAIGVKDQRGILEAKMDLGHIYLAYVLDYEQSSKYMNESLELAIQLKDKLSLIRINRSLSYVRMASGDFDNAKKYNEKAMEYAQDLDLYPEVSQLNSYMGDLYEMTGDTATAITYYEKVLDIETSHNFVGASNVSMVVIAHYYYLINDIEQSLKYYRIALKRFQRNQDQRWTSYTHSEMARLYVFEGQFDRAEQHALKGLSIAEKYKLRKELGDNYHVLSVIYDSLEEHVKSKEYLGAYTALQDSLIPIESAINMTVEKEEAVISNGDEMNGFLQALIIIMPVALLILFIGMPSKKT